MKLEKIFNTVTCNESREMTFERFKQAVEMLNADNLREFDKGYKQGYDEATNEACREIRKNYQPNK